MVRPRSIVRYEQLYLAALALQLIAAALAWPARAAAIAANPLLAGRTWTLWGSLVLEVAIALLLWRYTARRPHTAAKWIVVVLAVFAAIGMLLSATHLVQGRVAFGPLAAVGLAADILYIAAAALLFRPDARAWFGGLAAVEARP